MEMFSSGFNYSDEVLNRMAIGVNPLTGETVPLPSHDDGFIWGAPAGTMYSTCNDMAKFMTNALAYAMDSDDGRSITELVDEMTFAELQMSGTVAGLSNAFGGVGSGTYEWVHLQSDDQEEGHWAFTKAGCLEGYRSDTLLVPELGLGIFAVATSTCDINGDGDPITVPLANLLAPSIQKLLVEKQEEAIRASEWLPPSPARFEGAYNCTGESVSVAMEDSALVVRNYDTFYPMRLEYVDQCPGNSDGMDGYNFHAHMIGPYINATQCETTNTAGQRFNICPTSCMLRLFRGDNNYMQFLIDPAHPEKASQLVSPGLEFYCTYVGPVHGQD
eukprot:scaffold401_cov399-Prasinococcus_capsulatus_cf.AAC.8